MSGRSATAVLLLYYLQAVIVGRALSVGTQTDPEVYSLCNTNRTNKTRTKDEVSFNNTNFLSNTSFLRDMTFFGETWLFNDTISFNNTKAGMIMMSVNKSALKSPPDMVYEFQWEDGLLVALLGISSMVGTIGNAAVILAFCMYKKIRTTDNAFILNTSIWDLVTSAVIIPLIISSTLTGLPNCGQACCAFIGFLNLFSLLQSLLSCALIAFNRYVHVVLSLATYKRLFGPVKAFLWVVGSWVTGTLIMFPAMSGIYGSLGWDAYIQICQLSHEDPASVLFFKNVVLSMYWAVVFTISAFYARIYLHVRKSTMAIGQHLGYSPQQVSLQAVKRTKHMFYIFFTFLTLTCPNVVINYVDFYATLLPKAVFFTSSALYILNTAVNPVIYTWTLKEFRQGFKSMVRCRRHIVPNPQAGQPADQRPVRVINVLSRLGVSNRVAPSEPSVDTSEINT
ncbi:melatonin receptor type 1C-like [Branchiostoma floridae x Branchiostoma japonicum]